MAKGIEIGIASETKAFKQGVDSGIIDPLDDAIDKLDDLGKNRGPDKLEDGFQDAQTASEKLKRETKETADSIESEFRQSYAKMKRSSGEGTRAAKRDLEELGNEAKQNAAETFSSFDGSAESFADGIQGTLGGIVSSLGPVGAALGAVGAIGIGLIMSKLTKAGEDTEAFKQKVADLGQEFIDTGGIGEASIDFISDAIKKMASETDDGAVSLKDLKRASDHSKSSFKDLAQAYSGNTDKLKELLRAGEDHLKVLQREATSTDTSTDAGGKRYAQLQDLIDGQKDYNGYLKDASAAAVEAAKQEKLFTQAGGPELEAKADLIKNIDKAYDDAAGATDDYIDKETGLFDTAAYITAMKEREKALKDYQQTLAESDLSPEAKAFLADQGADAAASFLAGYKKASPQQKRELNSIWSEAGRDNSGTYTEELEKGIPDKIDGPTVTPKVTAPDDAALNRWLRKPIRKSVLLDVRNRSGQRVL